MAIPARIIILSTLAFHTSFAFATDKAAGEKESSVAVIGLRGGFDSNPAGIQGANGTPVVTTYATWDYLHGTLQDGYGLNLSLVETHYDPRALASARAHSLALKHGISLGEASALQSSLAASSEQTWSRRKSSLAWRERFDHGIGPFRLFASGEARITALNERNVFNLGDFLPRDENFGTLGLTTGAAWRTGETEIGLSFSASRVHYIEGVDYLGFRRDHNRLQPNLFVSTVLGGAAIEGSLSPFRAYFPEKEFDAVESLLYTAKLRLPYERFTLDLGSTRTVEDTTLPFSVINLTTAQLTVSALACAVLLSAIPAQAQYYGSPYRGAPSYDDDDDDDDDRPPPRRHYRRDYGYERPYYRQPRYGNICVTGRGDCPTPALPYGANCGCNIPGFGPKRGIVQ